MAEFPILPEPETYNYDIEKFLGLDLQTDSIDVNPYRSPKCKNVVRDYVGSVRKRYGYKTQEAFTGRINGVHILIGETTKKLVHSGDKYYHKVNEEWVSLYTGNDHFSISRQLDGKLYIVDGKNYIVYDGETIEKVSGKIPVIIIDRDPDGGGTQLEQINMLQPKRTEKYKGDGSTKVYQLTTTNLDATAVTAQRLEADGTLTDLTEGSAFTVNRTLGTVTFSTAPPVTPSSGEDNIFITYAKTVEDYVNRINKCDMSVIYGLNGAFDRLILTGNPDLIHYDWFSKSNDFGYFGDLDYSTVGQDNSAIMNYAVNTNGTLVTIKNNADNTVNSIVRQFDSVNNTIVLRSVGSIQAQGAISKYSFAHLEQEPMYISTENKVMSVTPADNRLENFAQSRSYYIENVLKNYDLTESYAIYYDGFYVFVVDNDLYLLDGQQFYRAKDVPYSHRQYECFYWENIGARILWVEDGDLWFGTADGKVKKFVKNNYLDEDTPVTFEWETPPIFTDNFNYLKTFVKLFILLRAEIRTGVRVDARVNGQWIEIVPYNAYFNVFDFDNIDFEDFTFETDPTERASMTKVRIKKVQQIRLRFTNDRDDPLSISKIRMTYLLLKEIK